MVVGMSALLSPAVPDVAPAPPSPGTPQRPSRARRLVRGRDDDPSWVRPALLALLAGTGVLYVWGLGASGWGVLHAVAEHARRAGLAVIADAKRGDIDISARAYGQAFFGSTPTAIRNC